MKAIKLKKDAIIPKKQNKNSPGYNLYSSVDLTLMKNRFTIDTDIIIEIPEGYYGKITSKIIYLRIIQLILLKL